MLFRSAGKADGLANANTGERTVLPAEEMQSVRGESGANKTTSGNIPKQKRKDSGSAPPILSDALYGSSCRQIDSMLSLF